jgi:nicotinamidase-related amidase
MRIEPDAALLLIVDIQTRLFPHIADHERVEQQTIRMARAARELGVPIVVSEQYREGLGPTVPGILESVGDSIRVEKLAFSVCGDSPAMQRMEALGRSQVLLAGIETHVCVQQTALDLLRRGQTPFVLADAVSSRQILDREIAFDRMRQAGAIVTTVESAIFELTREAGTDLFKKILPIVR